MERQPQQSVDDRELSPPQRRRRLSRFVAALCWGYFASVLGVWAVMRLTGERWWPATFLLFSPRWIWVAPVAILIPLAALFRRRMTVPIVAVGSIAVFQIMGFNLPWPATPDHAPPRLSVRLLTCNLHGTQSEKSVLDAFVARTGPDVIVLQEYTPLRSPAITHEGKWFTFHTGGMYVASRYPISEIKELLPAELPASEYASMGLPAGSAFVYGIDLPGGTLHLVSVHLSSPHAPLDRLRDGAEAGAPALAANSQRRWQESQLIRRRLRELGPPFLIAGDFNTPDDSPIFLNAFAGLNDAFSDAGFGFGTTYAKHHTWLRIDHIVSDPGWVCRNCRVGPDVGSGHHPVFAELER